MRENTCCFTGHRAVPAYEYERIRDRLRAVLISLIGRGFVYFGAGGALGFDTLAAETVLELKAEYPHIRLILILPCKNQDQSWSMADRTVYRGILERADKIVYTSEAYYSGCMHKRNKHLVDNSSVCVCYQTHRGGGTGFTVDYARESGLEIMNLR